MKRKITLLFALFLILTGCGNEENAEENGIPSYLVSVTVEGAVAGDTNGSGILYSRDEKYLNILTAAHVVESVQESEGEADKAQVVLYFFDGWKISCDDIVISETADVALLRIPLAEISSKRQKKYNCVETDKESFDSLKAGDNCVAEGFGGEAGMVSSEGSIINPWIYVEDYGQYMIWSDAGIWPGMSGGGLFDSEGYFIGLLSGGSEDGELTAVPLSLILQFEMWGQ